MAVTGWKDPSSTSVYTNNSASWANTSNVYTSNTGFSTVTVNGESDHQLWSGYGFTTSDIPSGATIDGIEVQVYNYSVDAEGNGSEVFGQLHAGGTTVGSAKSPTTPVFSNTIDEIGGATDLWGSSLTDSDIRGADFGVVYYADNAVNDTAYLSGLRVRVYYTEATEDDLTASDVSAASEASTATVEQEHALSGSDVESATSVASPTFGQAHVLVATDVESLSSVDTAVLVLDNIDALLSTSVEGTSSVASATIGQEHTLTAGDLESSTSVTSTSVTEVTPITAVSVESSSVLSVPHASLVVDLIASNVEAAPVVGNPSIHFGDIYNRRLVVHVPQEVRTVEIHGVSRRRTDMVRRETRKTYVKMP